MSRKVLTKENCSYGTNGSPVRRHCYLLTFLWLYIVTSDVWPESSWGQGLNEDHVSLFLFSLTSHTSCSMRAHTVF
jgi:hypothetical protein